MERIENLIEELHEVCVQENSTILIQYVGNDGESMNAMNGVGGKIAQAYANIYLEIFRESNLDHEDLMILSIQQSIDELLNKSEIEIKKCPRCGSEIKDSTHNYCTICGLPLKEEE